MAKLLKRLVYRSKSLVPHDDEASLRQIYAASLKNNKRDKITGCLAQPDGHFVQVVEGEADNVDRLMKRIASDPRHENVVILDQWPIEARLFQGWHMGQPDLTPLSDQSFRIINDAGSGAQVVGVLTAVVETRDRLFGLT